METNQKQSQELPAQNIIAIEPKQQSYDTLKAARIAETLRELLDPEYILLFGKLADGTPHSDILAYDLLVVTDGPTHYSWYDAKRYLKMKLPYIGHGAPYINLYIYTRQHIASNNVPFFYFARKEGIGLYSRSRKIARPRDGFDFDHAASVAARYTGTFMPLADKLAGYAECNLDKDHVRESAFASRRSRWRRRQFIIIERCFMYTTVSRRTVATCGICTIDYAPCLANCRCCSSRTNTIRNKHCIA